MNTIKRFLTIVLVAVITLTSIPTAEAAAATKIKLNCSVLDFHTSLEETSTYKLVLENAKASKITWKATNGYRYNSKGEKVTTKVSKIVKVSKKGNVRAVGYGHAQIVATYKGKKYTCSIHVADFKKQPIATTTEKVTSLTKKADKLFIKEVKNIINTYSDVNDKIYAAYGACEFKNVYDYPGEGELLDYRLGAFVNGWSYCDQTASIMNYFMRYFRVDSDTYTDFSMNHSWNYVVIDGVKYYIDADSGFVKFMTTEEEFKGIYDDQPWKYNENGNGRGYLYGKVIQDGNHLHQYFHQMKEEGKTTFKFRDWWNPETYDHSEADEIEQMMFNLIGTDVPASKQPTTYVGNGCTVVVENCAALEWENCSYTVTITDWNLINLD